MANIRERILVFGKEYSEMPIGKSGENLAARIFIKCENVLARWPGAVFSVSLSRADGEIYIADAGVTTVGGMFSYDLTDADVSVPGLLRMEVDAREGGAVILSATYNFNVEPGLYDTAPLPPAPTWVDEVLDAVKDFAPQEERRQANEAVRQSNEAEREAYYEEIQRKAADGEFTGEAATIEIVETLMTNPGTSAVFVETSDSTPQARRYVAYIPRPEGFTILAVYDTIEDLQAAHPVGNAGDVYIVGTPGSNTMVVWDSEKSAWTDIGPIGPGGGGSGLPEDASDGQVLVFAKVGDEPGVWVPRTLDAADIGIRAENVPADLPGDASETGPIATVQGGKAGASLDVTARLVATQSGTGDPSPDNVRPIVGRGTVTITRYGSTPGDNSVAYPVALPQTLYGLAGAPVTVQNGGSGENPTKLRTFDGTENWTLQSINSVGIANFGLSQSLNPPGIANYQFGGISTHLMLDSNPIANATRSGFYIAGAGDYLYIRMSPLDLSDQTVSGFKTYLAAQSAAGTPVQVLYELAAPQAFAVAPFDIPALVGENNVLSDGGGDTTAALVGNVQIALDRLYDGKQATVPDAIDGNLASFSGGQVLDSGMAAGQPNGLATLDGQGKIVQSIPESAKSDLGLGDVLWQGVTAANFSILVPADMSKYSAFVVLASFGPVFATYQTSALISGVGSTRSGSTFDSYPRVGYFYATPSPVEGGTNLAINAVTHTNMLVNGNSAPATNGNITKIIGLC